MPSVVLVVLALLLLVLAYLVFRVLVRSDYAARGRLHPVSSSMQVLVFILFFLAPCLFNPPGWDRFWRAESSSLGVLHLAGLVAICIGLVLAFGTLAWFGIGQAFGVHVEGLRRVGPYRVSRNPQVVGASLLVIGVVLQNPSLYSLGWMLLFLMTLHWMVTTEEEHLHRVFGTEYEQYCSKVPRYLLV
jgi:protein-S-isoprenylcysteine O-methyltransferase Ste14